jgi:hypothetical protein
MDTGELVYAASRLILGALAAFCAIMVWSKTRDAAWILVIIGTIAWYAEIVYSLLTLFGIPDGIGLVIGSLPLAAVALPLLPFVFFITAFLVMLFRARR